MHEQYVHQLQGSKLRESGEKQQKKLVAILYKRERSESKLILIIPMW